MTILSCSISRSVNTTTIKKICIIDLYNDHLQHSDWLKQPIEAIYFKVKEKALQIEMIISRSHEALLRRR